MLQCYNRGCGQLFDPTKNTDESCRHHPGAPYFHDAYKGWSCCKKKSVDFTEFLNIKGCTLSKHSNEKPPEPEKPDKSSDNDKLAEVIEVRAPIVKPLERPPIDSLMTKIQATIAPGLKDTIDALKSTKAILGPMLAEGEVRFGTPCKNSSCTYSFTGTAEDNGECVYHPGVPIFHEGLKFWSCCQKKTTDFAVFMAQKGCAYGQHKWFKENENNKKVVECRYDWHQTGSNVIVSIYARKYHYAQSIIKVNPVRLQVTLVFPEQENATFDLDLELRGIVKVDQASAYMYGTKVEITLPKMEAGSWQRLNFPIKKLPPPQTSDSKAATNTKRNNGSEDDSDDDEFNLDDIQPVNSYGNMKLTEVTSSNPNNLD